MKSIFTHLSSKFFVSLSLVLSFVYLSGFTTPNTKSSVNSLTGDRILADTSKTKWLSWTSKDSVRIDSINDVIYLYGDAELKSDDMNIKGDYIKYDRRNNIVEGIGSVTAKIKSKDISMYSDKIIF